MSFQSLKFLLFLLLSCGLCLSAGRRQPKTGRFLLTLVSAVFCVASGFNGFLVLCAGMAVTAVTARRLAGRNGCRWLAFGCVYHLAVLAAFKYLALGWSPVGISFFTFQQLWLLKEVYSGAYTPQKEDALLLYGLFFPTLTSGPILRPTDLFPQLQDRAFLRPSWQDTSAALYAICLGMTKKVLLADPLGAVVNNGWAMTADLSAPAAWLVMLCYTLQLYLDFSGYCDIATGIARLFGIRLPLNFNAPYRARSVTEFWKRWHITLTTFLRECLYFPLGGSKKGVARTYGNILLVFLVSGIWHGTGWTFLIWGGLHGLAQVFERMVGAKRNRLPKAAQWLSTFLFVNVAWVFFRAPSAAAAVQLLSSACSGGGYFPLDALTAGVLDSEITALTTLLPTMTSAIHALLLAALLGIGLLVSLQPKNIHQSMDNPPRHPVHALGWAILLVWAILSFSSQATFIYSNF